MGQNRADLKTPAFSQKAVFRETSRFWTAGEEISKTVFGRTQMASWRGTKSGSLVAEGDPKACRQPGVRASDSPPTREHLKTIVRQNQETLRRAWPALCLFSILKFFSHTAS